MVAIETKIPINPIPDLKSENTSGRTKTVFIAPATTPNKDKAAFLDACLAMIPKYSKFRERKLVYYSYQMTETAPVLNKHSGVSEIGVSFCF